MKFTAIFALIASSSAISYNRFSGRPIAVALAELNGPATKWDKDHPHPGFEATDSGYIGQEGKGAYTRVPPSNFRGPDPVATGDDQFMHSIIMKYSLEEATEDGKKTGKFVFPRVNAQLVAEEVLDTHMGLRGKAASDYLDKNFDRAFKAFDPAGTGKIDA